MDTLTPDQRRRTMRRVRSRDTGPERRVRRALCAMGARYRLHRRDLPGAPDIVFSAQRKAIFVHGCFWHSHTCKAGRNTPRSNQDYWDAKLARNRARDADHLARLRADGWRVLILWECELKDADALARALAAFLAKA
ncbi:MAG: DNA mismatch endonuclease Vsr [Vampirovibrionales bacterium]|nr:DNA mismatch endonuclease Vsr [Vampirovibrionales bacterium]